MGIWVTYLKMAILKEGKPSPRPVEAMPAAPTTHKLCFNMAHPSSHYQICREVKLTKTSDMPDLGMTLPEHFWSE